VSRPHCQHCSNFWVLEASKRPCCHSTKVSHQAWPVSFPPPRLPLLKAPQVSHYCARRTSWLKAPSPNPPRSLFKTPGRNRCGSCCWSVPAVLPRPRSDARCRLRDAFDVEGRLPPSAQQRQSITMIVPVPRRSASRSSRQYCG
jgi:hypothetical protein